MDLYIGYFDKKKFLQYVMHEQQIGELVRVKLIKSIYRFSRY